jgi:hypothetical protein
MFQKADPDHMLSHGTTYVRIPRGLNSVQGGGGCRRPARNHRSVKCNFDLPFTLSDTESAEDAEDASWISYSRRVPYWRTTRDKNEPSARPLI